ncbi:hypothetical protein ABMA27_015083 [Loxostege sticticalis]|uniref:Reverse transcriptase domain-containing protein n=1 Tax=Loxostege sticticalis TaxID=481309 RepID=A0ABR3I6B7_LOXSC
MIGSIENYKPGTDFNSYLERMEQFYKVNDVQAEKKVSLFLTLIGPDGYETLRNLIAPKKPSETEYEKLVEILREHYVEKRSVIAERYQFYKCIQKASQSLNEYILELKVKAASCNFGEFLNQALRDKFVCGIRNEQIIRQLLIEKQTLTFEKAIKIASNYENAEQGVHNMQSNSSATVGRVRATTKLECWRCGGLHKPDSCYKKTLTCFVCKKVGHIAIKCKFNNNTASRRPRNFTNQSKVNNMEHTQDEDKECEEIILGTIPIFHKAYSIPYAMKEEVERELLNLEKSGIIKRVQHSEWASPIVLAKRNDRKIRVCVDYKVTVNKMLDIEHYPLPLPEDIFNELSGAGNFCVLDLSGAYQQLLLDEHSREYLTINTHLGLFQPTRLQFGISSGPSVFQYVMDQILKGIKNVKCFIDDLEPISPNSDNFYSKNNDASYSGITKFTFHQQVNLRVKR